MTALLTMTLTAAPISGQFGITGSGVVAFTSGGTAFIDWCPINNNNPFAGSPPVGCPVVNNGTGTLNAANGTSSFAAVGPFPGTPGTIDDMADLPNPPAMTVAPYTNFPVNTSVMIPNYITLSAYPTYNFEATFLPSGSCAAGVAAGPFCLVQNGQNTSVTMTVDGLVTDTSAPAGTTPSAFTAVITGQFPNTTIAQVEMGAGSPGGIYSNTWSGTVTATVIPEPATAGLFVSGLLFLGLSFRRKRG